MAKEEGDTYSKVKPSGVGMGVQAGCVIHRWFTGSSGYGTTTRASQLRMPSPPMHAGQHDSATDTWLENVMLF